MKDKVYAIGLWGKAENVRSIIFSDKITQYKLIYTKEFRNYGFCGYELTKDEATILILKYDFKIKEYNEFNQIYCNSDVISRRNVLNELRPIYER